MLLFEIKKECRTSLKRYFPPAVEIKGLDVVIDTRNVFDEPIRYDIKPYESIRKNAIGQRDDCTTGCLIDYLYFKKSIIWLQET